MANTAYIVPIYEPDREWKEWLLREIYTGPTGTGRYVPNIDDKVFDWNTGYYRVTEVDTTTYLCKMVPWVAPESSVDVDTVDILYGVGPWYPFESAMCYIDDSVLPYRLAVDDRLFLKHRSTQYAKIFLGYDTTEATGVVISKVYDSAGNYVGENIPLDLVAMPNLENHSIRTLRPAHTTHKLSDGDLVTVVTYNDAGGALSKTLLRVSNTAFIRSVEANQRYIQSIEILSPFRSKTDPFVIEFPINVTLESVTVMGRVNYSDGYKDLAIDGTKFALLGLDSYVSTINGQKHPLTLRYEVGDDETAYANTTIGNRSLMAAYKAKTTEVDGAYSVKLFAFPCWDTALLQYELHWFLYNLDRSTWYYVNDYVELGVNSAPFKPRLYGTQQEMDFVIDLSKVDGRFAKVRIPQHLTLTLLAPPSESNELWGITYDKTYDHPFGLEAYANFTHISGTNYKCVLNDKHKFQDIWLKRFYYDVYPLTSEKLETTPPTPTHFVVNANGIEQEYPLSAWNSELVVPVAIPTGRNIYIHWIRRDGDNDLHLAVSAIPVRNIA